MIETKDQFDDIKTRSADLYASWISDKKTSDIVKKLITDDLENIYKATLKLFENLLKDPPPSDQSKSLFKDGDDCNNTKDSPNSPPSSPPPARTSSSGPSRPTTPAVNPVNPPSQPKCNSVPAGHIQDAHKDVVYRESIFFCNKYATTVVKGPKVSIAKEFDPRIHPGNDATDDNMEFKVNSVDSCPAPDGYNLGEPVKGKKCADILFTAWNNC